MPLFFPDSVYDTLMWGTPMITALVQVGLHKIV